MVLSVNLTNFSVFTAAAEAACAPVGGSGPYNASQIGGYLNYTVPNGTAPYVPLLNSSATASSTASPVSTFTGGAGSMRIGNEIGLGIVVGFLAGMAAMM